MGDLNRGFRIEIGGLTKSPMKQNTRITIAFKLYYFYVSFILENNFSAYM